MSLHEIAKAADELLSPPKKLPAPERWGVRIFLVYITAIVVGSSIWLVVETRRMTTLKHPEGKGEWAWKIFGILIGFCIVTLLAALAGWGTVKMPLPNFGDSAAWHPLIRAAFAMIILVLWMDCLGSYQKHPWWCWRLAAIAVVTWGTTWLFG